MTFFIVVVIFFHSAPAGTCSGKESKTTQRHVPVTSTVCDEQNEEAENDTLSTILEPENEDEDTSPSHKVDGPQWLSLCPEILNCISSFLPLQQSAREFRLIETRCDAHHKAKVDTRTHT